MLNTAVFEKPYVLAMYSECGDIKILGSFDNYNEADEKLDYYSNKFPNACIDIDDMRELAAY